MKNFLIAVVLFGIFFGCKDKQTTTTVPVQKKDTAAKTSDTVTKTNQPNVFTGMIIINKNTKSFRDCASPDSTYWIIDKTSKLENLYKKIYPDANVYNSVIAEVQGELVPTAEHKLTDKYPQTLVVKDVLSVVEKNSNNICVPYEYWAFGNNSEWRLEISKAENLIELEVRPEKKTYYFFYSDPVEEGGNIYYRNYNAIQRYTIEVLIKHEKCTEASTKKVYDYSFDVKLSGNKNFKGCGIKGAK